MEYGNYTLKNAPYPFNLVPGTIRYLARSGTWHDLVLPGTIWYDLKDLVPGTISPSISEIPDTKLHIYRERERERPYTIAYENKVIQYHKL